MTTREARQLLRLPFTRLLLGGILALACAVALLSGAAYAGCTAARDWPPTQDRP